MTGRGKRDLQAAVGARDWLRWFLDAIANGELTACPDLMARLEGAVAALDAVIKVTPGRPGGGLWSGVRRQPDSLLEARDGLRSFVEAIRSDELPGSRAYVARLEGAIAALDALLGDRPNSS